MKLLITSYGKADSQLLERLARDLGPVSGCDTRMVPPRTEPRDAFDGRSGQSASSAYLDDLEAWRREAEDGAAEVLLLGITSADLVAPRLNFIFGEARRETGVAVVSIHRLRPQFYQEAANDDLLAQRLLKESIHEIGHLRGLDHCHDDGCIMWFSNMINDTDQKGPGFCDQCQAMLAGSKPGRRK